jgi:hypothetical protein
MRGKLTGGWRKMLKQHQIYILNQTYNSDQIKKDALMGNTACIGEVRNYYRIIFRKYEGERPFERQRHRWDHSITLNLKRNRV